MTPKREEEVREWVNELLGELTNERVANICLKHMESFSTENIQLLDERLKELEITVRRKEILRELAEENLKLGL